MDRENLKSYLELQIVWKDDHMFELKVIATNGRYFGTTEVYDTKESLLEFGQKLIGFPNTVKNLVYEAGTKNEYAYFSMNFYCIDNAGHIGVELNLEENVVTEFRKEEKDKIKLEIIVEPNAIDRFQKELIRLATTQEGIAILYGGDNRLDD